MIMSWMAADSRDLSLPTTVLDDDSEAAPLLSAASRALAEETWDCFSTRTRCLYSTKKLFVAPTDSSAKVLRVWLDTSQGRLRDKLRSVLSEVKRCADLAAARKQLLETERLLEIKSAFVRSTSHETRTPLTVVLSGLLVLEQELRRQPDAALQEVVRAMKFSCEEAVSQLGDLLTYEKLTGNLLELDRSEADVGELVENVVGQFQIQARAKEITLELTLDAAEDVQLTAFVDEAKITQVVRNLVSNALKFSPTRSTVRVSVRMSSSKTIRLTVNDAGPGLSLENQAKLFRSVVQISPRALQGGGGSGLGLFICKGLVDLHEAEVGVFSAGEGLGAEFFLELKGLERPRMTRRRSSTELMLGLRRESALPETARDVWQPPRLLLVDDAVLCRRMTRRAVETYGVECSEAGDGLEALRVLEAAVAAGVPPHAILVDSCMPLLNGEDAVKAMRKLGFEGFIFGVTGKSCPDDLAEFLACGCDEVFTKPLRSAEITRVIKMASRRANY
jgi:signal transduction histidine kinase/CheY-like chemotaxis protein